MFEEFREAAGNGFWLKFCVRREALLVRVEVEGLHQLAVAAVGLKLRAA
ncbi:hypothetical protein ACIQFZ_35685 [Streptomyces sp. NPDC093064]